MPGTRRVTGPAAAAALLVAGAAYAEATAPTPAPPLRLVPRARPMSSYILQASYEIKTKNVTFDAPPAYKDSFAFWTGRSIGHGRREVYEFMTLTQEKRDDGTVPFRRTIPRFDLEMRKGSQQFAPQGPLLQTVKTLSWEGNLDKYGNVKELREVTTSDDPEIPQLAIPQIERVFPVLDGPKEIRPGESFKERLSMPLPTRLNIVGLEEVRLLVSRDYRLKEVNGNSASFEVKTEYALDPATPPKEPRTTCAISGGGMGEAVFDVRRGVFLISKLPSLLVIEIEAPLRRLPEQPETEDPGRAKTRMELELLITGRLTVKRVWGEEED